MGTKGDSNRQRIIVAANQLFYTRGYNQTSFRDISIATGIPRGNFYYYFKAKDDILSAVVDTRLRETNEMLVECEQATQDPRGRLLEFAGSMEKYGDEVARAGCPAGSLNSELAKDHEELLKLSRSVFDLLLKWSAQQFSELGFENADDRAMDLLARLQGIAVMTCAYRDRDFLQRSSADLKSWINSLTLN